MNNNLTEKQKSDLKKYCTKLINEARDDGFAELFLRSGVFLITKEKLIADQKNWSENDKRGRSLDFSTSDFWLTTDSGEEPEAVDNVQDLVDLFLEKNWSDRVLDDNDEIDEDFWASIAQAAL